MLTDIVVAASFATWASLLWSALPKAQALHQKHGKGLRASLKQSGVQRRLQQKFSLI